MAYPEDAQRVLIDGSPSIGASNNSTSTPVSPETKASGSIAMCGVVAFAGALVACMLLYLAVAVQGKWFSSAADRAFDAGSMSITRGLGTRQGGELVITKEGESGETVVSVVTDLRATDYPVVEWIAVDMADAAQVVLLWQNDYEPAQIQKRAMRVVSGRPLPIVVRNDPHWIGRITGLALAIHGPISQPIRLRGVVAKVADAGGTMSDRVREWTAREPWTGTSINTVTGGADIQELPLPLLLVAAIVLANGALVVIYRRRLSMTAPSLAVAAAALFLFATFLLDVRWTANLVRQARDTTARYGGKDWRGKHLAADDSLLFAFIEKARAAISPQPARVFVLADAAYFRGRAAFHLYPHNVWYAPYVNAVPPADRLHAGDFIVVYQRRGVQYDAAARRLRWDGGVTIAADLKLLDSGGALFVVR